MKDNPSRDEVYWCPRIWYWPYYGFCPSERAWYREMRNTQKWIETDGYAAIHPWPNPREAMVTRLRLVEHDEGAPPVDKLVLMVTAADHLDSKPIDTVCGVIVHEAAHVFRYLCKEIGERKPSAEFVSYTMQTIAQHLFKGYLLTRRPGEFVVTPESNDEATKDEPPIVTDGGKAASETSRTTHLDRKLPPPPAGAGPTVSHPRRRKAARRAPPAQ
jgi:hypothetical protein